MLTAASGPVSLIAIASPASRSGACSKNIDFKTSVSMERFTRITCAVSYTHLVTVSSCASLSDSLVSVGTSPYIHDYADWNFRRAKEIFLRCQDIRRLGSAALDLAYVACGRTDGFYEIYLSPWDYAAGLLLIEEAGGRVTDFSGNPPDCSAPSSILATNGSVHEELRELDVYKRQVYTQNSQRHPLSGRVHP